VLVDYVHDFDRELNFDGRARGADEMSQTRSKQMKADRFNIRYT